jgi:hypothetical protein
MNNIMDGLSRMFGGGGGPAVGAEPMGMENPYQVQDTYQRAMAQKQRAQQMMAPEYQGGGKAGILAGLIGILKGRSLDQKADETITQALGRQFEMDNKRAQAEAEKARAEEERKFAREIEKAQKVAEAQAKAKAQYAAPKQASFEQQLFDRLPPEMQDKAALGKFGLIPQAQAPQRPSEIEQRIALAQASGATPQQIQALILGAQAQPEVTPEERETAKAEATRIKEAEDRARAAEKTLANVTRMEEIMNQGLSTGPLDRFLPGKDRALFDSLASDLNLSTLKQNFGGNPTEGERAANAATLPGAAQYEANNKQLLAKLKAEAQAKIDEYNALTGKGNQTSQPKPGMTGDPLIDKYL